MISFFSEITWNADTSFVLSFICFSTVWCENGLFSLIATHSKPVSVFVIGTIGDTTTQLSPIWGNNSEQIESIFSYGIDNTRAFACLATVALSVPGATVLTLASGAIFGLVKGTLIVSFASTFGATLAFLISRFLLKDFFYKKFPQKAQQISSGFKKDGLYYLLILRLTPSNALTTPS